MKGLWGLFRDSSYKITCIHNIFDGNPFGDYSEVAEAWILIPFSPPVPHNILQQSTYSSELGLPLLHQRKK